MMVRGRKAFEPVCAREKPAAAAAAMVCIAFLAGCAPTMEVHPAHQRLAAPPESVSVFQLAGRLKLHVVRNSRTFAQLEGPSNCVTIFPDPGGAIYVNGAKLRSAGAIVVVDAMIFAPESSEWLIRAALRPEPLPPVPAPRPVRPVVVLDPGHGGRDPGAIAFNGTFEKDVVLPVALMVRQQLQRHDVQVVMTRETDCFVELDRRAAIADEAGADLFVSIHADSAPNTGAHGHTVYVAHGSSSESLRAAACIDNGLRGIGIHSRGVRRSNFRVLVRTACPAVLVETGYLSNRREAERLCTHRHRRAIAASIAGAVLDAL